MKRHCEGHLEISNNGVTIIWEKPYLVLLEKIEVLQMHSSLTVPTRQTELPTPVREFLAALHLYINNATEMNESTSSTAAHGTFGH